VLLPAPIDQHVSGWQAALVWESEPGACTWLMTGPAGEQLYLKTRSADAAVPLRAEAARLRWAHGAGLPVPAVLAHCRSRDREWLLTWPLPGRTAIDDDLEADPGWLVGVLADGLRWFHDVQAARCPFRFQVRDALERVAGRVAAGLVRRDDMHPEHARLTPAAALAELERLRPAREDLVVCHGDYCLPNVLISDGRVSGFLDLGELGVADRWWDLAAATWSVTWNLGPGWEDAFLAAYGVARDERRIAFYRLLYDMTS
jgi:aminoglycoside phosphotransferase